MSKDWDRHFYDAKLGEGKSGGEDAKVDSPKAEPKYEDDFPALEEVVFQSHLEALIAFCGGDAFQDRLEAFKRRNIALFREVGESKGDEFDQEHPLEFTTAFKEYTALIETGLEGFAHEHGIEPHELYYQARDAVEGQFCALFEEHQHKWFVDLLLEWLEYEPFVKMMTKFARENT